MQIKYLKLNSKMFFLLSAVLMLGFTSCQEDDTNVDPGEISETAYLYTGRYTTPDGRVFLMGAFPSVPDSDPNIAELTELAGTSVATFTANGFVFSWDGEASEITKWKVEDDLTLTEDDVLSLQTLGVNGNNFGHIVISETEAFTPAFQEGIFVKWNPTTMEISEEIDISTPPSTFIPWAFKGYISGDNIIYPLELYDWDNLVAEKKAVAAIFNTKTYTVTYAQDDRVQANSYAFQDEAENTYLFPHSTSKLFDFYGEETYPEHGGLVRIKKGATEFDPDFYVNVMEETGGAVSMGMFYAGNNKTLLKQVSSEDDFPAKENMFDFFNMQTEFLLFDIETKAFEEFPGKGEGYQRNFNTFVVDGDQYLQNPDPQTGNTRIDVLSENGLQEAFEIEGGDLNALYRIR